MGEVLASIIGAKKEGLHHQLFEVADLELANGTDIQLREILEAKPEELLHVLTNLMKLEPEHLETLADILIELAEAGRDLPTQPEPEDPLALLRKAQVLLAHATHNDTLYSMERADKLRKVEVLLGEG